MSLDKQPNAMQLRPGKIEVLKRPSRPWRALCISDLHLA
jgi:hypothetical protein